MFIIDINADISLKSVNIDCFSRQMTGFELLIDPRSSKVSSKCAIPAANVLIYATAMINHQQINEIESQVCFWVAKQQEQEHFTKMRF